MHRLESQNKHSSNPASATGYVPLGRPELQGFMVCLFVCVCFLSFLTHHKFTNYQQVCIEAANIVPGTRSI